MVTSIPRQRTRKIRETEISSIRSSSPGFDQDDDLRICAIRQEPDRGINANVVRRVTW
jgi:hypothetical protein